MSKIRAGAPIAANAPATRPPNRWWKLSPVPANLSVEAITNTRQVIDASRAFYRTVPTSYTIQTTDHTTGKTCTSPAYYDRDHDGQCLRMDFAGDGHKILGRPLRAVEVYAPTPPELGEWVAQPITRTIRVQGTPRPQGSKRHVGHGRLVEASKYLPDWRDLVAAKAMQAGRGQLTAPIGIRLDFVMPRPKATPRNHTPPAIRRPDLDKLERAVLDALTGPLLADDSHVVTLHSSKRIAEPGEKPGVTITATELTTWQTDAPEQAGDAQPVGEAPDFAREWFTSPLQQAAARLNLDAVADHVGGHEPESGK